MTRGFGLLELMIALFAGAIISVGLLRTAEAIGGTARLQQNLSALGENARVATRVLERAAAGAAYAPAPWALSEPMSAVHDDSADGVTSRSDRLVLSTRSDRDCFGRLNHRLDETGAPRFDLLRQSFVLRRDGNLAHRCAYGPQEPNLTVQINNQGLVQHVEAFQVQYAEDTDGEGNTDRWVRAGQWQDESRVKGVRFALLLASPGPLVERVTRFHEVLDLRLEAAADGRLRRVYRGAARIEGRP